MSDIPKLTPIQVSFLEHLIEKNLPVAIYLKNGIKLKGQISGFDDEGIILSHPILQAVRFSAVSTVAPILTFEKFETSA